MGSTLVVWGRLCFWLVLYGRSSAVVTSSGRPSSLRRSALLSNPWNGRGGLGIWRKVSRQLRRNWRVSSALERAIMVAIPREMKRRVVATA